MYTQAISADSVPYVFKQDYSLFSLLEIKDPNVILVRLTSLLEWGANINELEPENQLNLLQKLIIDDVPMINEIAELLMDKGIDVNHQDIDGCTALHFAVCDQRYELATKLLYYGANPLIVDKRNESALHDLEHLTHADPSKLEQREQIKQLFMTYQPSKQTITHEINLRTFGCETSKEAVNFIISHHLRSANLASYQDFDSEDLNTLKESSPHLKKLTLKSIKFSSDLLTDFTSLQSLSLGWCIQISDIKLNHFPKLENLNLAGCRAIPFEKLLNELENVPNLRSLNLSSWQITDMRLLTLIERLPFLETLTLTKCKLSDCALEKAAEINPALMIIQ